MFLERKISLEANIAAYNANRNVPDKDIFCYAPFVSLNFEQNGNVSACCYNRTFSFGNIRTKSLNDIWFGEGPGLLFNYIQQYDFSKGCHYCGDCILEGNTKSTFALNYDHLAGHFEKDKKDIYPVSMEFEMANTCNLACVMCNGYFSSTIREQVEGLAPVISPYGNDFVAQLVPFISHLQQTKFLGGEPFLIRPYYQIWEAMQKEGYQGLVCLSTNGSVLNDKIRELLEQLNFVITVSVDSFNEAVYNKIRLRSDFKKVMEHLAFFKAYMEQKGGHLYVAYCPMTINASEIVNDFNYCNEHGIKIKINSTLQPAALSLKYLPKTEMNNLLEIFRDAIWKNGAVADVNDSNRREFQRLVMELETWLNEEPAAASVFEAITDLPDLLHRVDAICCSDEERNRWNILADMINKGIIDNRKFFLYLNTWGFELFHGEITKTTPALWTEYLPERINI